MYYRSISARVIQFWRKGCNVSIKACTEIQPFFFTQYYILYTYYHRAVKDNARCNRSHFRGELMTSHLINIVFYPRTFVSISTDVHFVNIIRFKKVFFPSLSPKLEEKKKLFLQCSVLRMCRCCDMSIMNMSSVK